MISSQSQINSLSLLFFIHLFNKYYGSKNINAAEEVSRENKDSFPSKLSKIKEEKRKGIKLSETFVF
jgi:hypothetical protein